MPDLKISSVESFLIYLKKERGYSHHSIRSYQTDLIQFCTFLDESSGQKSNDFRLVTKTTIRNFLGHLMEKGLAETTVARHLASLKSFFKYLLRSEEVQTNPAANVKTPKTRKRLPTYLEEEVVAKLLMLPEKESSWLGYRDRAILELFYSTGIRVSELVNLSCKDVDHKTMLVRVLGKRNKERLVPFGKRALHAMEKYIRLRENLFGKINSYDPLFISNRQKRIAARTVRDRLEYYLKKFELSNEGARYKGIKWSPHTLRHAFATHMLDRGADIRAIKELLGHASLSSTQVYTHLQVEKIKKIFIQSHPHA
ncbi:MAG: site-specific tyrosine recombinase/integron integrase [Fidelibacterota bacterium]